MSAHKKQECIFLGFAITDADAPLLERLNAEHRQVLRMGGSYEAMADAIKVPVGTVKSRVHRARAALVALRKGAAGR